MTRHDDAGPARGAPPLLPLFAFGGQGLALADRKRLGAQLSAVRDLMRDGSWRTLGQIAEATGFPEASLSARLRDLRKPDFGSLRVEKRRVPGGNGLYEYRVSRGAP